MSRMPRLSVLLPVFHTERFLMECLRSLERQTWTDFEIVAVDDGSNDSSALILDSFREVDPRLHLVTQDHQGLIAALNRGLAACRGEFVARIAADDIAHPRRFELQLQAFEESPELDVVSSLVSHFPRQDVGEGFRIYEDWLNSLVTHEEILRERFIESPIPHPTVMIRRQALQEVRGYRDMGWPEDYDLWLRLIQAGKRFGKVPRVLCLWRQHEDRLTRIDGRYSVEKFLACKAHHLAAGPLASPESVVVWGAGQTGRRLSKHLKRLGTPLKAFIDIDPKRIGSTLRGFPIHPPSDLGLLAGNGSEAVVLAAVSSRGARALIRQELLQCGFTETEDFWCVA